MVRAVASQIIVDLTWADRRTVLTRESREASALAVHTRSIGVITRFHTGPKVAVWPCPPRVANAEVVDSAVAVDTIAKIRFTASS